MRHHARLLLSRVALLMAVGTFPASAQQPHMGEWADRGLWIIHERMVAEIAAIAIELEAPAGRHRALESANSIRASLDCIRESSDRIGLIIRDWPS